MRYLVAGECLWLSVSSKYLGFASVPTNLSVSAIAFGSGGSAKQGGRAAGVLTRVGWGQPLAPLPAAWPTRAEAGKASRSMPKRKAFCLISKSAEEAEVFAELRGKMRPSQVLKIRSLDLSCCLHGRSRGCGQINWFLPTGMEMYVLPWRLR